MPETTQPLTIGTAGHVNHGKTALVQALTGTDTDRLPEERSRGISIVLGYAHLTLPSGRRLSLIDVPGHERFVRTMVAGATGIDCFLMVVAADDGVMPQTREHAAVLRALAVPTGVVAITKSDIADARTAREQVAELLPGIPTIPVSARTGAGLEQLLAALDQMTADMPEQHDHSALPRLHVAATYSRAPATTSRRLTSSTRRWTHRCREAASKSTTGPERRRRVSCHSARISTNCDSSSRSSRCAGTASWSARSPR